MNSVPTEMWHVFLLLGRAEHEPQCGGLAQFDDVSIHVLYGCYALPSPCLLSTTAHSLIAVHAPLLWLSQQLPTQKHHCRLHCSASLSEWGAVREGRGGKHALQSLSRHLHWGVREGSACRPGNGCSWMFMFPLHVRKIPTGFFPMFLSWPPLCSMCKVMYMCCWFVNPGVRVKIEL